MDDIENEQKILNILKNQNILTIEHLDLTNWDAFSSTKIIFKR